MLLTVLEIKYAISAIAAIRLGNIWGIFSKIAVCSFSLSRIKTTKINKIIHDNEGCKCLKILYSLFLVMQK